MKVIGFHGTTDSARQSIESEGITIDRRHSRPSWLGIGFYLFQDAEESAKRWAKECGERRKEEPVVYKATVDLTDCVDLTDIGYWQMFSDIFGNFDRSPKEQLGPEALFRNLSPEDKKRLYFNYEDDFYITAFVAHLENQGQRVRSIRGAFIEGQPIHSRSWLFDRSHVQICVRDPNVLRDGEWVKA